MNPASQPAFVPEEIPESFFKEASPHLVARPRGLTGLSKSDRPAIHMKALALYDVIIDEMFAHPGITFIDVAKSLGRSPSTISHVVRSDFFRARYLQRRQQFNEEMNYRLLNKTARVLEKSLDRTLEVLEQKPNIPLPELTTNNASLLDRLGYGSRGPVAQPSSVQVNVSAGAAANAQASPGGLARAQEFLKVLEAHNGASGPSPGNASASGEAPRVFDGGPVVEGEVVEGSR